MSSRASLRSCTSILRRMQSQPRMSCGGPISLEISVSLAFRFLSRLSPLSPLLFALYINDIGSVTEECAGAVAGALDFKVSFMLYADDLCLLSNDPDQLQRMLDKLGFYAARKELVVNEKKSVVMHFARADVRVPVLRYRGTELAAVHSFRYLGMTFTRSGSMTAAVST